ncbi:MAG: alpha-amylase family glycosyl hydrolase [Pseudomonadota bacterium]
MSCPWLRSVLVLLVASGWSLGADAAAGRGVAPIAERSAQDEVIYFVLPDRFDDADPANNRGGMSGDALQHGYDPAHKGFYHGGDLAGLTRRLDYIAGLGATALWLAPVYHNRPVQGLPGQESAGYHGYWITDFTDVDPHFGSREDLATLVREAHARQIKVYLDIITNHTADVIAYRECHDPDYEGPGRLAAGAPCAYRSVAQYPYTTRGDAKGEAINDGFMGDTSAWRTDENWARLTRPDYAYTPYVPTAQRGVKRPAWLNDLRYYHNRGETTFEGENSLYGDFAGLDDLMTEHPRVVRGFIEIYRQWISELRIDGFRIDTARHVDSPFWQAFNPAMRSHADGLGIEDFYIFGEVYDPDPATLARFTRSEGFPVVLDFAFQAALRDVLVAGAPTERLAKLFAADALYRDGQATAARLPTFLGNHDMGRFAGFLRAARPKAGEAELLGRLRAAHALLFFARGVPVIYYGDEQGFVSDGNDQDAREDMFASRVAIYNDNDLLGTERTTADENFDPRHPLYRELSRMAQLYHANAVLRRGEQRLRLTELAGGVVALSRLYDNEEYLVAVNTRDESRELQVSVEPTSRRWRPVRGACPEQVSATGSLSLHLAPFEVVICAASAER